MGEPTDSPAGVALERRALGIQKIEVSFLLLHAGDSIRRGRDSGARFHRGPAVFRKYDLFTINPGIDPVQVTLDERPGGRGSSSCVAEKWQHVEVYEIDSVQNGLCATVGLETVGHIGDGDENAEGREGLLSGFDLGSESAGGQDLVEQGLRTELNGPGDKLGLGVILESREERIPAGLPRVATIKSELKRVGQ